MKQRKFGYLAVFALLFSVSMLISACDTGGSPTPTTGATGATTSNTPATGTLNSGTPATGATTSNTPATGGSASGSSIKVGLVTDVGKVDDKSFNQSAWEGVKDAATTNGYQAQYIETADQKDYATNIQKFVDQKYDIIVTVGFLIADATEKAAIANPNIQFIGVDQFQDPSKQHPKNFTGLVFEEDKAGYLGGALAAYMSKSGHIGAVLGTDNVPPVYRYGEGYRQGALSVNSSIKVDTIYHEDNNAFNDPDWGSKTAGTLISQGADVIFGAGGKTGNGALVGIAQNAAQSGKTLYAIGVDTDQYLTVPEAKAVLLSSATKDLKGGTSDLVTKAANKQAPGGNYTGKVGLAPFHDLDSKVSADVKSKLTKLTQDLTSGAVKTNVAPVKPSK